MKLSYILAFLLLPFLSVHAQSSGSSKSKNSWIEAVKKDAKVSTIISAIGKPDVVKTDGGFTRYYWFGKVEVGASSPESLIVFVEPFNGEKLVVGLTDGSSLDDVFWFAWASKVRPGL